MLSMNQRRNEPNDPSGRNQRLVHFFGTAEVLQYSELNAGVENSKIRGTRVYSVCAMPMRLHRPDMYTRHSSSVAYGKEGG